MNDVVMLDAVDLAGLVHRREVSCVEVMAAYLDHIDRFNPVVNAIVSLRPREELLAEAAALDGQPHRGRLHGMPVAVKDLTSVAGLPWTQGSPLFVDRIGVVDELPVRRMRTAGAIVIGKTNTPEFGLGSQTYNPVFGTTLNPYDTTKTAGGSSGGAAAALAMRMLPVADGSDYMGSLRNPSAFTNTLGLRPSRGRVPREDVLPQLGTTGPMGRTVEDVAVLLEVLAGPDPCDPLCLDGTFTTPLPPRDFTGTRIAWAGDFGGRFPVQPGVLDLCRGALAAFEGCVVEEAFPEFDMDRLWAAFLVWRWWNAAGNRELLGGPIKPELAWEIQHGAALSLADVDAAVATRAEWYRTVAEFFGRYDFVVSPSAQVFPFDATVHWPDQVNGHPMDTYHRWMEIVVPWTMAGLPVLGMPAGFGEHGLPMGIQLVGGPHDDTGVLQLARHYETRTDWVRRCPPPVLSP